MILWFALALVLQSTVNCLNQLTSRSTIFLEKNYLETQTDAGITIKKSPLIYLLLEGFGDVTITMVSSTKKTQEEVSCRVFSRVICLVKNTDMAQFDESETFDTTIKVSLFKNLGSSLSVKLVGSDVVELLSMPRYGFLFQGTKSVDLLVSFKDMPTNLDSKGKIQFFTLQGFRGGVLTPEYINIYMKAGDHKVTHLSADKTSTTTLGIGSVMTLMPEDKSYCFDASCLYSFRIDTQSIVYMEFQSVAMGSESPIEIGEGNVLVDQLRDNDNATYVINSAVGEQTWNWRFNLVPIEGNPDVAINGDTKPASYNGYRWKSNLQGNEDIVITGTEIKQLGLSGKKFYVYMTAAKQTTFLMTVVKQPPFAHQHIKPNEPITGEAQPGEIVNYFFKGQLSIPEKMEIYATIKTLSGDPDLYIKSCANFNTQECSVTEEDIKNAAKLSSNNEIYFRYSSEILGDDAKFLEFNCLPSDQKYSNFTFERSDLFTSKTCLFAIAVVGKSSSTHKTSKYRIELRGAKYHNLLKLNEPQNFRIEQEKTMYYMLDVDASAFKKDQTEDQFLNFKFVTISGDVDIFFSRTIPFPSETYQDKTLIVDNNNTQLRSTVKFGSFKGTPESLAGRYYIAMTAKQFILGSVSCSTGNENLENSIFSPNSELLFGDYVMNSMVPKEGAKHLYYFNLDVPAEQKGIEIVIQLTTISGNFNFCVADDFEKLFKEGMKACVWNDVNKDGNIVLQDNEKFQRKGKYGVLVMPVPRTEAIDGEEFSYSLSLSSQDSGVVLSEGKTFKISTLRSPKIFKVGLNIYNEKDVVIALTTLDSDALLECSLSKTDMNENSDSKSSGFKSSRGPKATLQFIKKELTQTCRSFFGVSFCPYMYCKISPSKTMPYEYSLIYFTPNSDFSLDLFEGAELNLPLPITGKYRFRHKPSDFNKSITVNVYSESLSMEVAVQAGQSKTYVVNDPITNVVFIPVSVVSLLKDRNYDNEIEIEITNRDVKRNPGKFSNDLLDLTERISVQVASGVKRLNNMVPILETQGIKGSFIFYKLVKPVETNAMIYLTLFSGEADLYARKGEELFPDLNTFDLRANSLNNDQLMIPASSTNATESKAGLETYIVGVYSRIPSSYQIVAAKNSSFLYQEALLDNVITKEVPKGSVLLLSFKNRFNGRFVIGVYGSKSKIQVNYKSHDESKNDDFFSNLPDKNDPGFTTATTGIVKRHVVQPLLGSSGSDQYLISIVPTESSDYITVFIEQEGDTLMIKPGELFTDSLAVDQCQRYSFTYDDFVIDESFFIEVLNGEVSVVLEKLDEGKSTVVLKQHTFKRSKRAFFKLSELLNQRSTTNFGSNFFKEIVATICSRDPASIFTTGVSKTSLTLHRLIPGGRFVVSLDRKSYHKVFYHQIHTNSANNIILKFDLQALGSSSTKVTSLEKALELLDIYYIVEGSSQSGSQKHGNGGEDSLDPSLSNNRVAAGIIWKTTKTESGSKVGLVKLAVQEGVLIVKGKTVVEGANNIHFQLILNDIYPIALNGKTLAYLEPNKEAVYEVIKPEDAALSITFTGCKGRARVEIFDIDLDTGVQKLKNTAIVEKLGLLTPLEDFNSGAGLAGEKAKVKVTSILSLIKITNLESKKMTSLTIDTELTRANNDMVIADYFVQHEESLQEKGLGLTIQSSRLTGYELLLQMPYPKPAQGFETIYKDYYRLIVQYSYFLDSFELEALANPTNTPNLDFLKKTLPTCALSPELAKSQNKTFHSKTLDFPIKDGVIDWSVNEPAQLEIKIPNKNKESFIIVQTKLTFLGGSSDSSDDDAVVLWASSMTFYAGGVGKGEAGFTWLQLVTAAMLMVCLVIGGFKLMQCLKANRDDSQVRRVVEEGGSQVGGRQIETVDDGTMGPGDDSTGIEMEGKGQEDPRDLSDTI